MAYQLSATKLQYYSRCPRSYYYRYEQGIKDAAAFGSASLGQALHHALAAVYRDWHYQTALPPLDWLRQCWDAQLAHLSPQQTETGWNILSQYYSQEIQPLGLLKRPLAVEGRIAGQLIVEGVEFKITGRYDRLDALEGTDAGLALIDYKSGKTAQVPSPGQIDLQLGLYYLALEQHYPQTLKSMSLVYLRTGKRFTFEASEDHKQRVKALISQLALKLRQEQDWPPQCSEACSRCSYARYCPAVSQKPEPVPERQGPRRLLQLSFAI